MQNVTKFAIGAGSAAGIALGGAIGAHYGAQSRKIGHGAAYIAQEEIKNGGFSQAAHDQRAFDQNSAHDRKFRDQLVAERTDSLVRTATDKKRTMQERVLYSSLVPGFGGMAAFRVVHGPAGAGLGALLIAGAVAADVSMLATR